MPEPSINNDQNCIKTIPNESEYICPVGNPYLWCKTNVGTLKKMAQKAFSVIIISKQKARVIMCILYVFHFALIITFNKTILLFLSQLITFPCFDLPLISCAFI